MKGVKKDHLPTRLCATCGRPFTWRKKWERDWEQVRYCSDRCRAKRGGNSSASPRVKTP
ncbi:MAG: DUF2256 domain-containing protein [Gemmatimonadaceae bacterium]